MEASATGNASAAALRRHAILCVLGASACFSMVSGLIKSIAADIPAFEIALFRSAVVGLAILPLLHRKGGLRQLLRTRNPWGHVMRTGFGFAGMVTSFYGYAHLPLATNTALGFAMPLFLTILSVPFLGERVGWRRVAAVLAGMAGVLIMVQPWQGDADALPMVPVLVVLGGVVCWAFSMISIRRLGAGGESNEAIILWFSIGGTLLAAICTIPFWIAPTPLQLLGLAAIGLGSAVAQMLMTEGYRSGEATLVAPFEYGAIIYTTLMGMLIWSEYPDSWSLLGITIIIASGLYIWHRETVAKRP
jgi:drug/metabolite transporter (DMT)-like permease